MAKDITYVGFGDLTFKSTDDGSMFVYGKATGPDLDLDQQICDESWLKTAMPQWLATGANVREMHSSIAAGVGIELNADGDDWYLKSEVVDANTMKKVEKGVLKGYSIGIKGARIVKSDDAPNGRIVGGQIVEVSLVDRPANPTATVEIAKAVNGELEISKTLEMEALIPDTQMAKEGTEIQQDVNYNESHVIRDGEDPYPAARPCAGCNGTGRTEQTDAVCEVCGGSGDSTEDVITPGNNFPNIVADGDDKAVEPEVEKKDYSDKQRQNLADKGQALPDGSYPIKTVGDLKNAIQSFGRAKDKAATKSHIIERAKALGKENLIPENWKAVEADVAKEIMHNADDLNAVRQSLINLIHAELDEMANGEENEICDITELLCALDYFLCWWDGEADENETEEPFTTTTESSGDDYMAYIGLGVSADLLKSASADNATDEIKSELRNEIVKALGLEETITTKAELAEAKEELNLLKAALDEVREMAAPGGPVLRATQAQASKSADAERLQSEAGRYRKLAHEVVDPSMKAGYLNKAAEMEADAKRILHN